MTFLYSNQLKQIINIIFVFNSDNDVPIVDNLAPIENITSFGQCGPNYGQFNIFSFISTLFGYTYPFDYPYHKVDNYVLFRFERKLDCTKNVRFQMFPQIACPRKSIVTLFAFVWLFSTVNFQMCPQSTCMNRCKVTLVAFVWLFSTVYFQMCPQSAYMNRCKVTLVAFVWLFTFTTVHFQMSPQIACTRRGIITLVAFVWLFSTVGF